jgi:hypothetical protein
MKIRHVVVDEDGNIQTNSLQPNDDHGHRFRFSSEVVEILQEKYLEAKYPDKNAIVAMSTATHLSAKQVRDWFKNRRNREPRAQGRESQSPVSAPLLGRGRTSHRRHLSSSNSCNSISSLTTQSWDSVINEPVYAGKKRKLLDRSSSQNSSERHNRRGRESEPSLEPCVTYQCTVCSAEFTSPYSWKRHEESRCLSRRLWSCLGQGWCIDNKNSDSQTQICVFCGTINPPEDHIDTCRHRIGECLARPSEARYFNRKDYLKRHLVEFHQVNILDQILDRWESSTEQSQVEKDWTCGFCGEVLLGWDIRATHIAKHYREGLDMSAWMAFKKVPLQSLSIGAWSFVTSPDLKALSLTFIPVTGLITYTMTSVTGIYSMQYSTGDIESVTIGDCAEDPWYRDEEEVYVVELRKPPRFYFHPVKTAHPQQCGDFTEGGQATAFFAHTLVGLREHHFSSFMRELCELQTNALARSVTDDHGVSPPSSILLDSELSRYCPFCYESFPRGCGKLSHSMYSACSECGKKNWNGHECEPAPERCGTSSFVCKVTFDGNQNRGCGARFDDYLSWWLHLLFERTGSECRKAVREEKEKQDQQDLVDMFEKKLSMKDGKKQQRSEATVSSSTATVIQHPRFNSEPLVTPPSVRRLIFPTESYTPSLELESSDPILEADSTGRFRNWVAMSPEAIGVSPAESGETVASGESFNEPWMDEELN